MRRNVLGSFILSVVIGGFGDDVLAQCYSPSTARSSSYVPYSSYPKQRSSCYSRSSTSTYPLYRVEERRVWVPGRWVCTYDSYGREIKYWQPPGWQIQRVRVPLQNMASWSGGPVQKFTW